jgi:hypothetical protein
MLQKILDELGFDGLISENTFFCNVLARDEFLKIFINDFKRDAVDAFCKLKAIGSKALQTDELETAIHNFMRERIGSAQLPHVNILIFPTSPMNQLCMRLLRCCVKKNESLIKLLFPDICIDYYDLVGKSLTEITEIVLPNGERDLAYSRFIISEDGRAVIPLCEWFEKRIGSRDVPFLYHLYTENGKTVPLSEKDLISISRILFAFSIGTSNVMSFGYGGLYNQTIVLENEIRLVKSGMDRHYNNIRMANWSHSKTALSDIYYTPSFSIIMGNPDFLKRINGMDNDILKNMLEDAIYENNIGLASVILKARPDVGASLMQNVVDMRLRGDYKIFSVLVEFDPLLIRMANTWNKINLKDMLCEALSNKRYDLASIILKHRPTLCLELVYDYSSQRIPIDGIILLFIALHPALVTAKNKYDQTFLHFACQQMNLRAVSLLVDAGADVNATDDKRKTPLHIICSSAGASYIFDPSSVVNTLPFLTILLQNETRINELDCYNRTPLDCAIHCYDLAAVRALMDKGARLNGTHEFREMICCPFPYGPFRMGEEPDTTIPCTVARVLDYAITSWCPSSFLCGLLPKQERLYELLEMKSLDLLVEKLNLPMGMGSSPGEELIFYATVVACRLERAQLTEHLKHLKAKQLRDAIKSKDFAAIFRVLRMPEIRTYFWQKDTTTLNLPESLSAFEQEFSEPVHASSCMTFGSRSSSRYNRF